MHLLDNLLLMRAKLERAAAKVGEAIAELQEAGAIAPLSISTPSRIPVELLTPREQQIFEMMARKTMSEIAKELNLSRKTIESNRHTMVKKFNLKSSYELAQEAKRLYTVA